MQLWYNRQGEPIDAATANELLADTTYVRIARTRITSSSDPTVDFDVSTVWLGCNYGLLSDVPVLFETMVFGGSEDQDQSMWRYSTEQQAVAGHREVVATIAATVHDEVVADEAAPAPAVAPQASVLDRIDDTLADWNGSRDSMRWRPDGSEESSGWTLIGADGFRATIRDVLLQTTSTLPTLDDVQGHLEPFTLEFEFPLAEPTPEQGYWEAAALRRTISAMFDIQPRLLGLPPRYGFDARYRQRLKNRRKRRH